MLKVSDSVAEIIFNSEVPLTALAGGYLNLTAYAQSIQAEVEEKTKKNVTVGSIVVALSRLSRQLAHQHPLEVPVHIENLTVKSPLVELVFEKNQQTVGMLRRFYASHVSDPSEFTTVTQGTSEITIICHEKARASVEKVFTIQPKVVISNLVALSVRFPQEYQEQPNILYSLLRRIAVKKISLAEVVSTYTELTFILEQKDLEKALTSFRI